MKQHGIAQFDLSSPNYPKIVLKFLANLKKTGYEIIETKNDRVDDKNIVIYVYCREEVIK